MTHISLEYLNHGYRSILIMLRLPYVVMNYSGMTDKMVSVVVECFYM